MRGKRILSILMAVTLLGGTVAQAVEAREKETRIALEAPKVTVVGNHVTDTDKKGDYELSLYVQGDQFQTVGVVLSYNPEKLAPVAWDNDTAIAVSPGWTKILPTKGIDDLSGKPALLCAKATAPAPEPEPDTIDDASEGEIETPVPPAASGRAYLYLGAEALQGRDYSESETRVVTVRFRLAAEDTKIVLPTAGQEESEIFDICLATDAEILGTSIPGMPLRATVLDGSDLPVTYKYRQNLATGEEGAENPYTVAFDTRDGDSINTGSSEPIGGGGNAITFFDWDGRAIDAVSAEADTAAQVVAGWENLHRERLSKPGYAFDRWLVVYENNDGNGLRTVGGTFTSNNAKLDMTDPVVQQDAADLSNLFKNGTSVFLQAAYYATEEVNQGEGVDTSLVSSKTYYTFGDPTFYQYGGVDSANGQYAVRYTVERASAVRAREPVVIAKVYVGSGSNTQYLTVKVDLENTDSTNFEVVVPKATTSIQCQILDAYGASAWIFGTARNDWTNDGNTKIVKNGAFDRLMDEAVAAAANAGHVWNAEINTQCFMDAGYTGVNNSTKLNDAQQKLTAAVISNGGKKLTDAQANAALSGYGSFVRVTT